MPRQPWHESSNPDRLAANIGARIAVWAVIAVAVAGVIGGGVWAFKVVTSDVKGAGDQTRIVNDGRNRVNAQEWFEGQYQQIVAADQKLDDAKANLDANVGKPDESFYRTNYSGLKNRCVEMVGTYNAEANKVSRGQWRSYTLPAQVDDSDPKTDCKETAK